MKKLMKGNEAIAEAAVRAGCRFFFGYPITPQNEIPEYMSRRLPEVGGCFLQAESEVSAINMVYGAGGAGARVMTSSSSPGISLKQEGISYLVGAEVPCVIVNMMRCGPGLGGIQPAQSDYYQATRGGGHGDYRTCVLAPASVQEAVDLTQTAFDIADRYRNPVMVLGDGLIGQMMEPVEMDNDYHPAADLTEKTWAANGHVPTDDQPRSIINSLYIEPTVLERHCQRLEGKYAQITEKEMRWQEEMLDDAEVVVIAYGTTSRVARSAIRKCREQGIKAGMLRPITLWPFPAEAIRKTIPTAKHYLVVEMSAGQMVDDVRLAVNGERPVHFYGRMGGIVPSVGEVVAEIGKYAEPVRKDPMEAALETVIDEKLTAITGTVREILKKAKKTISETQLYGAYTSLNFNQESKETEADAKFSERSFDEIEAKFKSALDQMKVKLKEASDKLQETSSEEMERKVREAADMMAQRIKETAMRVEQKIEEAGLKQQPEAADEPQREPEPAAQAAEPAAEEAAAEVEPEAAPEAAADEAAQTQAEPEPEPETAAEARPAEAPPSEPEEDDLDDEDEDDDFDEDEEDDDEDDFDDEDEDEDDDDEVVVETAAEAIGAAAYQTPGADALEIAEEAAAKAETAPEHEEAKPEPEEKESTTAPDSLEAALRSAAEKLDNTFGHVADKLDKTLSQAADKLDDLSSDDIDEKLKSAAQAVDDKLEEAGRKIEEFFSDPAAQTKPHGGGGSDSIFNRIIKSFTRSGGAKQEPGDTQTKPAEPQDKEDEKS